jgi:hypothetical protein
MDPSLYHAIKRYLDNVSKLLDMVCDGPLSYVPKSPHARAILIAYLWTMWQRSETIFLSELVRGSLVSSGFADEDVMLALSFPKVFLHPQAKASWRGLSSQKSQYMCAWAFELLQASRGSLAFDFRGFHRLFTEAHSSARPRCTTASEVCHGSSPENCGRLNCKELVLEEQSLHDGSCRGCERVTWDRDSYIQIVGGRAVDITRRSSKIKYCSANEKTLAVSHVWSHGQGGRPSTGINRCLHERYVALAKTHRCTSYWIDTVCIPEEHELRMEAISHINETFSQSKITLICDRDLASMKAPFGQKSVNGAEQQHSP